MGARMGFLTLIIFGILRTSGSGNTGAKSVLASAVNDLVEEPGDLTRDGKICALCEEYASAALYYLGKNKTQKEILEILRLSCTQMGAFKPECIVLVDHYVPLLLSEVSAMEPHEFCKKVSLCKGVTVTS